MQLSFPSVVRAEGVSHKETLFSNQVQSKRLKGVHERNRGFAWTSDFHILLQLTLS